MRRVLSRPSAFTRASKARPPGVRHVRHVAEGLDPREPPLGIQRRHVGAPIRAIDVGAAGEEGGRAAQHLLVPGEPVAHGVRDLVRLLRETVVAAALLPVLRDLGPAESEEERDGEGGHGHRPRAGGGPRGRTGGVHRGFQGLAQGGLRVLAIVHRTLQLRDRAAELDLGGGLHAQVA